MPKLDFTGNKFLPGLETVLGTQDIYMVIALGQKTIEQYLQASEMLQKGSFQ